MICSKCGLEKQATDFPKDRRQCRACRSVVAAQSKAKRREQIREKARADYWKDPEKARAVASNQYHKDIEYSRSKQRSYQQRNPHVQKSSFLKRAYGLTIEDYERILNSQHGVCKICGSKDTYKKLAVDHCHTTGRIRGLLCQNCNHGLGKFKDSAELLIAAVRYLETTNASS